MRVPLLVLNTAPLLLTFYFLSSCFLFWAPFVVDSLFSVLLFSLCLTAAPLLLSLCFLFEAFSVSSFCFLFWFSVFLFSVWCLCFLWVSLFSVGSRGPFVFDHRQQRRAAALNTKGFRVILAASETSGDRTGIESATTPVIVARAPVKL